MGKADYDDVFISKNSKKTNDGFFYGILIAVLLVVIIGGIVFIIFSNRENTEKVEPEVVVLEAAVEEDPIDTAEIQETIIPKLNVEEPVIKESVAVSLDDAIKETNPNIINFSEHVVGDGESLETIATLYKLSLDTIISINQIKNIAAIIPGSVLEIPNMDGKYYTVQNGDMLSTIASRFDLDIGWFGLKELNDLDSEVIVPGQKLFIPSTKESLVSQIETISFLKPLNGLVTGFYSEVINGEKLKGIHISSAPGSVVKSSQEGTVLEVGKNDKLGRFLILEHAQGYKTTYAHLESIVVREGEDINKHMIIGTIGTSDKVFSSPTLYFMLEQNGIYLDPNSFF